MPAPVYCTKIASRLARTYTDKHGLKDLVRELLGVDLSKQQQISDWGAGELTEAQVAYAASDVLHLHALGTSSTPCWPVRAGRAGRGLLPLPARTGSGSTWPAGPPRTFFPILNGPDDPAVPRAGHISGQLCRKIAKMARGRRRFLNARPPRGELLTMPRRSEAPARAAS